MPLTLVPYSVPFEPRVVLVPHALADEDRGRDDGRPEALLVSDGGLGDVLRADDLVGQPVDFLLFVPALIRVELEAKRGGEHFGGELLGVVAGDVLALAE